jgi:hypothetical protein
MFIIWGVLLFFFLILFFIFLANHGIVLIRFKIFNIGFFGDLEILVTTWRFLFLIIVVVIRTRVLAFSFTYISGLFVRNFIVLYLSFIIRIL